MPSNNGVNIVVSSDTNSDAEKSKSTWTSSDILSSFRKQPPRSFPRSPRSSSSASTCGKTATPASLLQTNTVDGGVFNDIWDALCSWVKAKVDDSCAVTIPNFGTLSVRVYNPGIRIPQFDPDQHFMNRYMLNFHQIPFNYGVNLKLSYGELAVLCKLDNKTIKYCIEMIIKRIGEAMTVYSKVEINIGIGVIICNSGSIDHHLVQKNFEASTPRELEIRCAEGIDLNKKKIKLPSRSLSKIPKAPKSINMQNPWSNDNEAKIPKPPSSISLNKPEKSPITQKRLAVLNSNLHDQSNTRKVIQQYPSIVDRYSRMLGAELGETTNPRAISDRIACNYSLEAANLAIKKGVSHGINFIVSKVSAPSDSGFSLRPPSPERLNKGLKLPLVTISGKQVYNDEDNVEMITEAPPNFESIDDGQSTLTNSVERYMYYLQHGFKSHDTAEMNKTWTQNVIKLIASMKKKLDEEKINKILQISFREMMHDFNLSIRKSILNYVLMNEKTCQRLLINYNTIKEYDLKNDVEWGMGKQLKIDPNPFWKLKKRDAKIYIENHLMLVDTYIMALHYLWADFDNLLLVDLPQDDKESLEVQWKPPNLRTFEKNQMVHAANIKKRLISVWFFRAKKILSEVKNDQVLKSALERPKHYFNCVAALMSLQIRRIVMNSIAAYVKFFEKFMMSQRQKNEYERPSAFLLELTLDKGKIKFKKSLDDLQAVVLNVLYNIPNCLSHIERVESKFDPPLVLGDQTFLWSVGLNEDEVLVAAERIKSILRDNMSPVIRLQESYREYGVLANGEIAVDQFVSEERSLTEYRNEVKKYYTTVDEIKVKTVDYVYLNLFAVDCSEITACLIDKSFQFTNKLLHTFAELTSHFNLDIRQRFKVIAGKLSKKPVDLYELVDAEAYVAHLHSDELKQLMNNVAELKNRIQFLFHEADAVSQKTCHNGFVVEVDLLESTSKTFEWSSLIDKIMKDGENLLFHERSRIEASFIAKRSRFQAELEELESEVNGFQKKSDLRHATTYVVQLEKIKESIKQARLTIDIISDEESKLGWVQTDFLQLDLICELVEPYCQLWSSARDYREANTRWLRGNVFELNAENVERHMNSLYNTICSSIKPLADISPGTVAVAETLKQQLLDFKENVGIISAMSNYNLRPRHWKSIAEAIGFVVDPKEHLTLQRLIDLGVKDSVKLLQEISETATMENSVEVSLNKMSEEWISMEFQFHSYKSSGTFILSETSVGEVNILLDDHIIKTQSIRCSQYAKPFYGRAVSWERTMLKLREVVELLSEVGKLWQTIEPIFKNGDIKDEIPSEYRKFHVIDGHWRTIMSAVVSRPLCLAVVKIEKIVEILKDCRAIEEDVMKGLDFCLERKRAMFPRLYFLSNDELIGVFSAQSSGGKIHPFLRRMFIGVDSIELNSKKEIVSISSVLGEQVTLVVPVVTVGSNSEVWLSKLEKNIQTTIQGSIRNCVSQFSSLEFGQWLNNWPEQLLLCIQKYLWTMEVEKCLICPDNYKIESVIERLEEEKKIILHKISEAQKPSHQNILRDILMSNLHCIEVTRKLNSQHLESEDSFEWLSQLRSYWNDGNLTIKILKSCISYGYEYLGNCKHITITPLTERCYHTLFTAINFGKGGCIVGPSGTGKSETIKYLANLTGKLMVFQMFSRTVVLSEVLQTMKGIASSGAWLCFDNLHNLRLQEMCVISDICGRIQDANNARESQIIFDENKIRLKRGSFILATINSQFGNNLLPSTRNLFRSVSLIAPDTMEIVNALLAIYGFAEPKTLAKKIIYAHEVINNYVQSTESNSSGPLISSLKKIIFQTVELRENSADDMSDETLIMRAIYQQSMGQFIPDSSTPLIKTLQTIFLSSDCIPSRNKLLYDSLLTVCENLSVSDGFFSKIEQLYDLLSSQCGIMVFGPSQSGKSTLISSLSRSLCHLHENQIHPSPSQERGEHLTQYQVINPDSLTLDDLYGHKCPKSSQWKDGIVVMILRMAEMHQTSKRMWLIFDGFIDEYWSEGLNSLLDDSRSLTLTNNVRVLLPPLVNIFFETPDMSLASPTTVTRCGLMYMNHTVVTLEDICSSWIKCLPQEVVQIEGIITTIQSLFDLLEPSLQFADQNFIDSIQTKRGRTISFFSLLSYGISDLLTKLESMLNKQCRTIVECIFLQSLVWGVGNCSLVDGRKQFEIFLRALINGEVNGHPRKTHFSVFFPSGKESIYSYLLTIDWGVKWELWTKWYQRNHDVTQNNLEMNNILTPNINSCSTAYYINQIYDHNGNSLLVGPTGCGKSKVLTFFLDKKAIPQNLLSKFVLSYQSSPYNINSQIEMSLERRGKNCLAPPPDSRFTILFEDLHLPKTFKHVYQPAIESLRHLLDKKMMYEKKKLTLCQILDVVCLATINSKRAIASTCLLRLTGNFIPISMTDLSSTDLISIYSTVFSIYTQDPPLSNDLSQLSKSIIKSSVKMLVAFQQKFLPIPSKSHYHAHHDDILEIVANTAQFSEGRVDKFGIIRLWVHEVSRVLGDRLIERNDIKAFYAILKEISLSNFSLSVDNLTTNSSVENKNTSLVEAIQQLQFVDSRIYKEVGADLTNSNVIEREFYLELPDASVLKGYVDSQLIKYNFLPRLPHIFLCEDAICHILRLSRILRKGQKNALLLGYGGVGRVVACKIVSFLFKYRFQQFESCDGLDILEWKCYIKKMILSVVSDDSHFVFTFKDSSFKHSFCYEDLSQLIQCQEVLNLVHPSDLEPISSKLRECALDSGVSVETREKLYSYFKQRFKSQFHLVLVLSPVKAAHESDISCSLRKMLVYYPVFAKVCTIDAYLPWSDESLFDVAQTSLQPLNLDKENLAACMKMCIYFYKYTSQIVQKLRIFPHHATSVTPLTYLDQINLFIKYKREVTTTLENRQQVLKLVLRKITNVNDMIQRKKNTTNTIKPTSSDSYSTMKKAGVALEKELLSINKGFKLLDAEEKNLKDRHLKIMEIQKECDEALSNISKEVDDAKRKVRELTEKSIAEMYVSQVPLFANKLIAEAIAVLYKIHPVEVPDSRDSEEMNLDYWQPTKPLIRSPNFVKNLLTFDAREITDEVFTHIAIMISNPEFTPKNLGKSSSTASVICQWVMATVSYARVLRTIDPKLKLLVNERQFYEETKLDFESRKNALQERNKLVSRASVSHCEESKERDAIEIKMSKNSSLIQRSESLIDALSFYTGDWEVAFEKGKEKANAMMGNVLLASAYVSYIGQFNSKIRDEISAGWIVELNRQNVAISTQNISTILLSPGESNVYAGSNFAKDYTSNTSATIIKSSYLFPLLIDPHQVALSWIIKMESKKDIIVMHQHDPSMAEHMKLALRSGLPAIIQDIRDSSSTMLNEVINIPQKNQSFGNTSTQPLSVFINGKKLAYKESFRLYLFTQDKKSSFIHSVAGKVSIVFIEAAAEFVKRCIVDKVTEVSSMSISNQKLELEDEIQENQGKIIEAENTILFSICEEGGDLCSDSHVFRKIVNLRNGAVELHQAQQKLLSEKAKLGTLLQSLYSNGTRKIANLFFTLMDIASVHYFYQFSLNWLLSIVSQSIKNYSTDQNICDLESAIKTTFKVCRSGLFEKDKQIFDFLLSLRLESCHDNRQLLVENEELRFLTRSEILDNISDEKRGYRKPSSNLVSSSVWDRVCYLAKSCSAFRDLPSLFQEENCYLWTKFLSAKDTTSIIDIPFNGTRVQRLCLIRSLRYDSFHLEVLHFIQDMFDADLKTTEYLSLPDILNCSNAVSPIIVVRTPEFDSKTAVQDLAANVENDVYCCSSSNFLLKTDFIVEKALKTGSWIYIQNCDLTLECFNAVDNICRMMDTKSIHVDFRLWLSTGDPINFPVSLLLSSMKLIFDQPYSLRGNVLFSCNSTEVIKSAPSIIGTASLDVDLRRLIFSLCLFHATLFGRKQYGALSWNQHQDDIYQSYSFGDSELLCSLKILGLTRDWRMMAYLTAECVYTSGVALESDRSIISSVMEDFYFKVLSDEGEYLGSSKFKAPSDSTISGMETAVNRFPLLDDPAWYNFVVDEAMNQINQLKSEHLRTGLFKIFPIVSPEKKEENSADEKIVTICLRIKNMLDVLKFEKEPVVLLKKLKTTEDVLVELLYDEVVNYFTLISFIKKKLKYLLEGLLGNRLLGEEEGYLYEEIYQERIPTSWLRKSYLSGYSLLTYVENLIARAQYIEKWVQTRKIPEPIWIGAFFSPKRFYNVIVETLSISKSVAANEVSLKYTLHSDNRTVEIDAENHGKSVFLVSGLYLRNGTWSSPSQENIRFSRSQSSEIPILLQISCVEDEPRTLNKESMRLSTVPVYMSKVKISAEHAMKNLVFEMQLPLVKGEDQENAYKNSSPFLCIEKTM